MPYVAAQTVKCHVEELVSSKLRGTSIADETSKWLRDIGDDLHSKLAKLGLVTARGPDTVSTVAEYKQAFVASKPHIKASTRRTFQVALDRMTTAMVRSYGWRK